MHDRRRGAVLETDAQAPQALTKPAFEPIRRDRTAATPDRETVLYDLHDEARSRGISPTEETDIIQVGNCKQQVDVRIEMLVDWLAAHPA